MFCVGLSMDMFGVVSTAADVLWMRGVGGPCEMCMCLVRGGVGRDGVSG